MKRQFFANFVLLSAVLGVTLADLSSAFACPDIDGLVDMNCDQKLEIACFGDSITAGVGDSLDLGYPGRLQMLLPNVVIYNHGRPGEKTSDGKVRAPLKFALHPDIDYAIILEGVNDYWQEEHTASKTRANLLSMVGSAENVGAVTLLGKLTQVRRDYQVSWVKSVNSAISPYTAIDFYSLGTGIIGSDKLHPNGSGYNSMANLVDAVLSVASEQERPSDRDGDGIYDFAESQFSGNPDIADTDGDGILDGEEVFTYHSSPALLDTDGDGHTDPEEIAIGADPSSNKPSAPTVGTVEAVTEL